MEIPIANVLNCMNKNFKLENKFNFEQLNGVNFIRPNVKQFPLLKLLNCKFDNTFFEIILVSINDYLVKEYLMSNISYISLHKLMLKLLKNPYFVRFFNSKPKNINEIKFMVQKVNKYLEKYLLSYEKLR